MCTSLENVNLFVRFLLPVSKSADILLGCRHFLTISMSMN